MDNELVQEAARQFGGPGIIFTIQPLGQGLIHQTYKVTDPHTGKSMVLQSINRSVFKKPADIVFNYGLVYQYLETHGKPAFIPPPLSNAGGEYIWKDRENNCWRATGFIDDTYSPMTAESEQAAYTVAKSFGALSRSLSGLDSGTLRAIIPGFHQLANRYEQFESAVAGAPIQRLLKSTHVIAEWRQRDTLVHFYNKIRYHPDFPDRVMHHDCKISNILFDRKTNAVICPVDLDTLMPGKFFSDLGDMIRSMACTVDENSVQWEDIDIKPETYSLILGGYLEEMGEIFSGPERESIHYAGIIMTYMQGMRFLADFLHGDTYYKTEYPEQNLNRALNQLILLEKLEIFLSDQFDFNPYHTKNS